MDVVVSYGKSHLFCFFFFQAEDGIRDTSVTGVQSVLFRLQQINPLASYLCNYVAEVQRPVLEINCYVPKFCQRFDR